MDPLRFVRDNTYGINKLNISPEKNVEKLLIFFSSVCAATAIQPIPFADIFILTPIQLFMGKFIGEARGYKFSISEIYKEILGVLGLSFLAQQTAIGLYKVGLPFVGGFMTIPLVFILTYSIGKVMDFYFVSKTRGKTLTKELQNFDNSALPYFAIKEAVFPFNKFPNTDVILGPENKYENAQTQEADSHVSSHSSM